MRPHLTLQKYRTQIRHIVLSHRAMQVRVFGSVLRKEDTETSDLDLLVEPTDEMTLFDIGAIRLELQTLLGISIDVVTPQALPASFRQQILDEAEIV